MAARPQSIFDADDTDLCLIKKTKQTNNLSGFFLCVGKCVCNIRFFKLLVELVNASVLEKSLELVPMFRLFTVFNFHNRISQMFYDI